MVAAIIGAYLATSIAIPLVWDYRHPTSRPRRRTTSHTGTMRMRGVQR